MRQALQQRNAAAAAADEAPPMSWAERRKHSATIADILKVLKPMLDRRDWNALQIMGEGQGLYECQNPSHGECTR